MQSDHGASGTARDLFPSDCSDQMSITTIQSEVVLSNKEKLFDLAFKEFKSFLVLIQDMNQTPFPLEVLYHNGYWG